LRDQPRWRRTEQLDAGRDIRQWVELPDEARNFLLGPVFGAGEYFEQVGVGEVRAEHQQAGEVEFTCGDGVEQRGKAAHEAGGGNAAVGFLLRGSRSAFVLG
jgi:hypothetical protein